MPELDISSILQLPQLSTDRAPQNGEVFATTMLNHLNMASPLIPVCLLSAPTRKREHSQKQRHGSGITWELLCSQFQTTARKWVTQVFGFPGHIKLMFIPYYSLLSVQQHYVKKKKSIYYNEKITLRENFSNRFAGYRVATNLQFVKKAVSVKQDEVKHNKTTYAYKTQLSDAARCLRLTSSRKASLTDSLRLTWVTPTPSSWHRGVIHFCSFVPS